MSSSYFPDSFDQFADDEPVVPGSALPFDDGFLVPDSDESPPSIFASDPADFSSETNSNGPILPPLSEMEPEEGYALREWRRQNAIRLEEKETREKEVLSQIIVEADEYKVEFHRKRQVNSETNRATNREKEKVFVANQEKFHAEADKDYWKSIAELIPKEVPAIEKRKGKKDQENKPSVAVVHGPKPGKPTDLGRMRQLLIKLKL
ncbi:hypothetical protein ABTP16_02425, partial [Acinetobacter baumannii]